MMLRGLWMLGLVVGLGAGWGSRAMAEPAATPLCEPWQTEYTASAAQGPTVIALWPFTAGAESEDASGHGHKLKLEGAQVVAEGRFGGALQTARGWPVEDQPHRAVVANHADFNPTGAFTLEMWLCPAAELASDYPEAFLLDKKYVAEAGYQLILGKADKAGTRIARACLGFGSNSETWYSQPIPFETGRWTHLAFTYDGEGRGRFFVNGKIRGEKQCAGRKAVAASSHPLSIGDRIGSYYHGFPGRIDQVRIARGALEFRPVKCERVSDRACFVRMEANAVVRLAVTNLQPTPLPATMLRVGLRGYEAKEQPLGKLAPGASTVVEYPLDTRLRPGEYTVEATLVLPTPDAFRSEETFPLRLVARRPPYQYPVLMWGGYGNAGQEFDRLQQIGFTHVLGLGADNGKIWEAGQPIEPGTPEGVRETKQRLDEALARGITLVASLSPGRHSLPERFQRVNREGKPRERDANCGLFPEIQQYCFNVGTSMAQAYGGFPAFGAALIHTEVRDGANCCFHPLDQELFKKAAGLDIPPQAVVKTGVDYRKLPEFPESRVISDQDPLYLYYRWYWKQGDGWNELNSQVVRGLKAMGRKDFWTFHDPAVRVASVYGSGGEVDVLSHWTYSYPDPLRMGLATDELLAMAGGRPDQSVMKMTQIIWYRSQTAPEPKTPEDALSYRADWEIQQPDAPFITIAPMHLREAFWTKIARPIRGIMYHGWQSLVLCEPLSAYRYTNPQSQHELARLVREVLRPLGPTLLQVPGIKSDVAYLESFASQMFAHRGTYGWGGGWGGDGYLLALWAHLQPEIVYDETIVERGLDGVRVLFMLDCDVITEKMAERILAFQAAGGIVIGDDRLTPAIRPDVVLKPYLRTGRAQEDKAALLALAGELRKQLDGRYSRYADTSTPDVVPYRRQLRDTDYLFVVNDHREYGTYVGHHGRVMEDGVPSSATLSVTRPAGFVYDLVQHKLVGSRQESGRLVWDVLLGPCDGACYLVTSRAVNQVGIRVSELLQRGQSAACSITVSDVQGKPIDAVVPVEVTIRDSSGAEAEFSGSYGAVDGSLEIPLDIASNDPPGVWSVEVRELASGRTASVYFRVRGDTPWPPAKGPLGPDAANPVQPKG